MKKNFPIKELLGLIGSIIMLIWIVAGLIIMFT